MQIASLGIDPGKTTFHLVALDQHGKVITKKKLSRQSVLGNFLSGATGLYDGYRLAKTIHGCW